MSGPVRGDFHAVVLPHRFPNYLTGKGITALKAGFMTTVPFLAAFFGVLLSGWLADKLVKKASHWALRVKRRLSAAC